MRIFRSWFSIPLAVVAIGVFPGPSLSAQIYQAPVDTGRMAWGHKDYTRYASADACDRAIEEVAADQRRTYIPDTTFAPPSDPRQMQLPEPVIAAARACGGQLTVARTDPRELWSLVRISLTLGNDAQATAAIERQLSLQPTPRARANALQRAIITLLQAVPRRLSMTEGFLQQLEAVGAPGNVALFGAHLAFADYWHGQYNIDSIRAHANQAIAVSKTMSQTERNIVLLFFPYEHLIDLANEAGDLQLQEKLLEQASLDIGEWRNGGGADWVGAMTNLLEIRKRLYGKKTRALEGSFWFNHNGVPQPAPGTLSLIVQVSHLCDVRCYGVYEMIKSLHAKYGSDLAITFVTETRGFAPGSGPLAPADEAQHASEYFLNFLHLPIALLVDESPTSTLPDGRIQREMSNIRRIFADWKMVNSVLTDRLGNIRWLGRITSNHDRRMLDAAIGRAAQGSTTQTTPGTNSQ